MAITFVLHEATRTGAPRLGGLIARELAREEEVRAIVMKDGPLTPWLKQTLGASNLVVCRDDPFHFRRPFEERARLAEELLEDAGTDLVYANSLATSVFVLAAAKQKRKSILHVHEKSADMLNLLACEVTKIDLPRWADAVVLAADDIRGDLIETFQLIPPIVEKFGIAVEVEAVRHSALAPAAAPRNGLGAPLTRGGRMLVGMCGHASHRKGADIFLATAAALPDIDFLWVGGWRPEETSDNLAYSEFERDPPPNLYLAGAVDNPYPYLAMMDLFFLSSREDPNPLVLAEALALGVPLMCFSRSTAIGDRLGRCALLSYGKPNVADAARILAACSAEALRRPSFRSVDPSLVASYDLKTKMTGLRDLIARLRGRAAPEPPPETDHVIRRDLGQGVTELMFS